jgi:hypothetical protein
LVIGDHTNAEGLSAVDTMVNHGFITILEDMNIEAHTWK